MKVLSAIAILLFAGWQAKSEQAGSPEKILASGKIPPASAQIKSPAHYRLITEYNLLNPNGAEAGTHVVTGEFTASPEEVRWTSVTVGQSAGHGKPVTSQEHRAFMEGFSYKHADLKNAGAPGFFKGFPAEATDEKSLVWDEIMFHVFVADNLGKLRLNQPFALPIEDVPLAGNGTFTNRRIELTWTGISRRNGEDCVLIHYEALLNSLKMNMGAVTMQARSDYLGDIWVSRRTRQIEYGTLLEEVAGTLAGIPNAPGQQPLHVLRIATLERLP